jgi:hypothetical protein
MSTCHFCQTTDEVKINGNTWTDSEYIRVNLCSDCFHVGRLERAPRAPRRPRQARPALYGDYAQLAAFSGIATDGSGRVNR